LTPTISAMNEETNKPQLEREAREFDQAIFVHKILRSNKCGNHLLEAMRRPLKKSQDIISVFHKVGCVELDKVILQRQENGLCYVTIQNDEHLNSEDDQLMNDLEVAVDLVNLDSKTLVGIMRGGDVVVGQRQSHVLIELLAARVVHLVISVEKDSHK